MGSKTGIEWTDATWNPILGCSRVSEGCRNCYAERIAGRFQGTVYDGLTRITNAGPVWSGKIVETKQLDLPTRWRAPRRVFVNSMSDLFHENVSDEQRDRIFAIMALAPRHTFQVLTKRPDRMREYLDQGPFNGYTGGRATAMIAALKQIVEARGMRSHFEALGRLTEPLANVWLGVSVENQAAAIERIPALLKTPAAVRFVSCEPLLGPLDLTRVIYQDDDVECLWNTLTAYHEVLHSTSMDIVATADDGVTRLDWVIAGGESGPHARPMHPDWIRGLRDQCLAAGVPFFFKQWGEWLPIAEQPNESEWSDGEAIVNAYNGDIRGLESLADESTYLMRRVGKKAAGAAIDGRAWREFPAVRA